MVQKEGLKILKYGLPFVLFISVSISGYGLTEHSRISILTYEPGNKVYSIFGHTAIRVSDNFLGIDYIYNFGTFDFNTPFFLVKFFRGDLDYFLSVNHYNTFIQSAFLENRKIYEQVLDLTIDERNRIYQNLEQTCHSDTRVYRYDFLYDNCATRVRDAVVEVKNDFLVYDTMNFCCQTFRQLLMPYISEYYWYDLGINLALGREADKQANSTDFMFLPDYIYLILQQSDLADHSEILLNFSDQHRKVGNTDLVILTSIVLLIFVFFFNRKTRTVTFYAYHGFIALNGLLLALIVLFTRSPALKGNFNLLWTLPALLMILTIKSRYRKIARLCYAMLLLVFMLFGKHLYPGFSTTFLPWMGLLFVMLVKDPWRSGSRTKIAPAETHQPEQ